jgi:hypothetical protein
LFVVTGLWSARAQFVVEQFVSVVGARPPARSGDGSGGDCLGVGAGGPGSAWCGGRKGLARKVHARNPIRCHQHVSLKYARRSLIEFVYYDVLSRHMHSLCVRDNREAR